MNRSRLTSALILIASLALAGCVDEPTYQGRTASHWVELSRDHDSDTRLQAVEALASMQNSHDRIKRRLEQIAATDPVVSVRIDAALRGGYQQYAADAISAGLADSWNRIDALSAMLDVRLSEPAVLQLLPDVCAILAIEDLSDAAYYGPHAADVVEKWLIIGDPDHQLRDALLQCAEQHRDHPHDDVRDTLRRAIAKATQ